jgi:hypothetical protein
VVWQQQIKRTSHCSAGTPELHQSHRVVSVNRARGAPGEVIEYRAGITDEAIAAGVR